MKKLVLVSILNVTMMTASFAAMPLVPQSLLKNVKKQSLVASKAKQSTPDEYPNFSGEWEGTCDTDPDEIVSMSIQQEDDASALTIDQRKIIIDAINSEEHQALDATDISHLHLHWSDDGQQLMGNGVFVLKPGSLSQGGFITAIVNMKTSLQDEKLVVASSGNVFVDGEFWGVYPVTCTYTKKQ